MRVSKSQIVHGITEYIQGEIVPKLGDDKAMQIIMTIGVNAAMANNKMVDAALENEFVRALLDDDGNGMYEIGGIAEAMRKAIDQYGSFPVRIPAIPLISPHEIVMKLNAADVDAIRRRIETSV